MTREQAINYLISSGFSEEQVSEVVRALTYEPTPKNNLGVDKEQLKTMMRGLTKWYVKRDNTEVGEPNTAVGLLYDDVMFGIDRLPSVTPQLSSELEKNSKKLEKDFDELDCISRKAVLDKIQRLINAEQYNINENGDYMNYARERVNAYEAIQFFVENDCLCPSVTPQEPRWIPISERLPEAEYGESNSVLVCFENGTQDVLYFNGSNWCYPTGETYISVNHKNDWHNKVVAWMPLPSSYSEVEE